MASCLLNIATTARRYSSYSGAAIGGTLLMLIPVAYYDGLLFEFAKSLAISALLGGGLGAYCGQAPQDGCSAGEFGSAVVNKVDDESKAEGTGADRRHPAVALGLGLARDERPGLVRRPRHDVEDAREDRPRCAARVRQHFRLPAARGTRREEQLVRRRLPHRARHQIGVLRKSPSLQPSTTSPRSASSARSCDPPTASVSGSIL